MPRDRACKAKTKQGKPCKAAVPEGRQYCVFHDPERVDEAQAMRSRGGSKQAGETGLDVADPKNEDELLSLASRVTGALARGEIDNKRADTILKSVKVSLQVIKQRREQMPERSDDDLAHMTEEELVAEMEQYIARRKKEKQT